MIMHYKIFNNDNEFTIFQKENEITIRSINPIIDDISLKQSKDDFQGNINIKIIVVFNYKNEEVINDK